MQIASILLVCKLPNTSNFQILGLQLRNCQFGISSSLLQYVTNPQTFLGKQKAFTKQTESLFSELRVPRQCYLDQHFPTCYSVI